MDKLTALCKAMITYDKGDPRRIHHFLKVHAFARQIGMEEELDALAGMMARSSRNWDPMKPGPCWKHWNLKKTISNGSAGLWAITIPTEASMALMPKSWRKQTCW